MCFKCPSLPINLSQFDLNALKHVNWGHCVFEEEESILFTVYIFLLCSIVELLSYLE